MKKIITTIAMAILVSSTAFAHHHGLFWGGFAGGLAGGLIGSAISRPAYVVQAPVVAPIVTTTPAVSAPVVTTTTAPVTLTCGYYNNVYCPTYSGYYYYNNAWVWGGGLGYRPPVPVWRPYWHHGGWYHPHHFHHHHHHHR